MGFVLTQGERVALVAVAHHFLRYMPKADLQLVGEGERLNADIRSWLQQGIAALRDSSVIDQSSAIALRSAAEMFAGMSSDVLTQVWENEHWIASPNELRLLLGSATAKLAGFGISL